MNKLLNIYKNMNIQVKVVFWFTFVGFLQRGISIVTTPVFTRVLTTEQYGQFSVFNAWYTVIVIVATLSLHMGVINNAFVKLPVSQKKVVSSFQSLSLVAAALMLVIGVIFHNFFSDVMGLPVMVVLFLFLGCIFKEPYDNWIIYNRYQYAYKKPVFFAVLISILTPVLSLAAVLAVPDEVKGEIRIISYVLINTIIPGSILYVVNYRKDKTFFDAGLWKYALFFNLPLIPHYLSETILNQTDKIMINSVFGSSEAGIYSIAHSAASLIMIFSSAMNTAFVPWQYQKLEEKNYKTLAKMAYLVLGMLALILLPLVMFGPEVVAVLAGKEYSQAVYLIPTLGASVFFNYMYQIFARVEMFYERKSYTVIATFCATVANIILNLWWMPILGYQAAGYSTLAAHILFCILHYFFYQSVSKREMGSVQIYDGRIILCISFCVLIGAMAMTFLYSYFLLRIIVLGILLVTVFLCRKRLRRLFQLLMNSGHS